MNETESEAQTLPLLLYGSLRRWKPHWHHLQNIDGNDGTFRDVNEVQYLSTDPFNLPGITQVHPIHIVVYVTSFFQ